jgi:phage gpG-like protein
MGIRFDIEMYGDRVISRELTRFSDRGLDARPAFEAIADQLMRSEKRRFSTRGNGTWEELAASTRARKAKSPDPTVRANAGRVLAATGALRRSFTTKGAPGQVLIIEPRFMVFGSSLKRAEWHQRGTSRMPARKPLGFTETAKRGALRTLQRYVVTGDVDGSLASSRSRSVT